MSNVSTFYAAITSQAIVFHTSSQLSLIPSSRTLNTLLVVLRSASAMQHMQHISMARQDLHLHCRNTDSRTVHDWEYLASSSWHYQEYLIDAKHSSQSDACLRCQHVFVCVLRICTICRIPRHAQSMWCVPRHAQSMWCSQACAASHAHACCQRSGLCGCTETDANDIPMTSRHTGINNALHALRSANHFRLRREARVQSRRADDVLGCSITTHNSPVPQHACVCRPHQGPIGSTHQSSGIERAASHLAQCPTHRLLGGCTVPLPPWSALQWAGARLMGPACRWSSRFLSDQGAETHVLAAS
jgi:hypothetical protein